MEADLIVSSATLRLNFVLILLLSALGASVAIADDPEPCANMSIADLNDPKKMKRLIERFGGEPFQNPLTVTPTDETKRHDIVVQYGINRVLGCDVKLRNYNGKVFGETIKARPGDTLYLRLVNALPAVLDGSHKHPQVPAPAGHSEHFNFNVTNLHTHGLHTAPQGPVDLGQSKAKYESDNVLIEVKPSGQQEYRIKIHDKHPAGTFWYHAHIHGSTGLQLASGMAGALIIEGGTEENGDLDAVPEIKAAKSGEKVFLLQQFGFGLDGTIESLSLRPRPTLVNGQLVPRIHMRPGEVQRWRFVHAGTQENIALSLDGHRLNEVAADGISLGRSVAWPNKELAGDLLENKLVLAPGYRVDVLIKAELEPGQTSRRIFLRDIELPNKLSLRAAQASNLRNAQRFNPSLISELPIEESDKPEQLLAEVIIEGEPINMSLPTEQALKSLQPVEHPPITDAELDVGGAQAITLQLAIGMKCLEDGSCEPCTESDPPVVCGRQRYLVNGRQFSESEVLKLKLNTAAEWTLKGLGTEDIPGVEKSERHPFHIHVNPFYYLRSEPDGQRNWVWKDTLLIPVPGSEGPEKVRMRYTRFMGKFVLHCHILIHEDQGMMKLVEIIENSD